ncbi:MAG TPA: peptidase S15, partial [Pseudonocardiaceae bacterium]|nr:peptidase S15 [Pseudonocardiaceae bacterium]
IDLQVIRRAQEHYSWIADDFGSARGESEWTMTFSRAQWSVRTVSRTVLTCTAEDFLVHAQLDGYEGEQRVFARNWNHTIPRDCL